MPYWDGGYMANPALFPLFDETMTDDILLVQINPVERRQTPRSVREKLRPAERDHLQRHSAARIAGGSWLAAHYEAIGYAARSICRTFGRDSGQSRKPDRRPLDVRIFQRRLTGTCQVASASSRSFGG
jgi:predicted acylesterase/phospholipase RssA